MSDNKNLRSFDQQTGNYDQTWLVERVFDNRTSLVVDPPDGRIPPLTDGDSRGRWDGDTLVVDTTNFAPTSNFRGSSETLHLIERFTRIDAGTLEYSITIDDPTTWTKPWTAMIPLRKTEEQVFEYACHEGNIEMAAILSGARAEEQAARRGR